MESWKLFLKNLEVSIKHSKVGRDVGSVKLELIMEKAEKLKRKINCYFDVKNNSYESFFSARGHHISTYLDAVARKPTRKLNIH